MACFILWSSVSTGILIFLQCTQLTIGRHVDARMNFDSELEMDFEDHRIEKRSANEPEPDYPIQEYLENCGMTHALTPKKSFKFVTPYYGSVQYPASVRCNWTFIGDGDCTPGITCKDVDLRSNSDCEEEYLEFSDGVGGYQKLCGKNNKADGFKSGMGGRDIFVTLKTMDTSHFDRPYKGVFCEAKCGAGTTEIQIQPEKKIKEDSRCVCGVTNKNDRIVNGQDAKLNEFPWLAAIVSPGTRSPKCGASIINDRWILSAAHCFALDKTQPHQIEILTHAHTLDLTLKQNWADKPLGEKGSIRGSGYQLAGVTDDSEHTERYQVAEIINHPLFTAKFDYDVAVIRLMNKIDLGSPNAPTPICLPSTGQYDQTFLGRIATVAGWGLPHEDAGSTTRVLQKLEVPVIDLEKCRAESPYTLTQRMLCAGYMEGGKDACSGDSGGPLAFYNETSKQWSQIGLVSWGEGCARKQRPGLYSRVTELVQWVRKHTSSGTWCRPTL